MLKLRPLLEKVSADKADVIRRGLDKKYDNLPYGTFGIEIEWANSSVPSIDPSDYAEEIQDSMIDPHNWPKNRDEYFEWVFDKRKSLNKRYWIKGDWDDTYGPVDGETWEEFHTEPDRSDFSNDEDFNEDYKQWESDKKDVEWAYSRWENHDLSDYKEEWAKDMFDNDRWENYTTFDVSAKQQDISEEELEDARNFITQRLNGKLSPDNFAGQDSWSVGPDAVYGEIRTPPLTEKDFDKVKLLLDYTSNLATSDDTSAHVHVGLPSDFDIFDMLVLADLVDEDAIQKAQPIRNYEAWSKFQKDLHGTIIKNIIVQVQRQKDPNFLKKLKHGFTMPIKTLNDWVGAVGKTFGTNIDAALKYGTIEFRYFSSEYASEDPDMFIKWIKYFLMLPRIAENRKRVTLKGQKVNVVFTRLSKDAVNVQFKYEGDIEKVPTPSLPPESPKILRKKKSIS
jgi:hypothetical protein